MFNWWHQQNANSVLMRKALLCTVILLSSGCEPDLPPEQNGWQKAVAYVLKHSKSDDPIYIRDFTLFEWTHMAYMSSYSSGKTFSEVTGVHWDQFERVANFYPSENRFVVVFLNGSEVVAWSAILRNPDMEFGHKNLLMTSDEAFYAPMIQDDGPVE